METILVSGFFVGLVYAILGVGLVVVYRGSRVVNFAHGETGMLAAFVFTELRLGRAASPQSPDTGIVLTLLGAIVVAALLGLATERLVVRPLRGAPAVSTLVATLAVGALILTFASRRWGINLQYTKPLVEGAGVSIGGLQVLPQQLLILAVAPVVVGGLWILYRFTPFGLRLRAVALDHYAAGLIGVDVDRTSTGTWMIGGVLAGVSAILIAPLVTFNVFFMTALMVRGLAAALVGGLTSVTGAVVAGISIGILEAVVTFKSPVSGLTDALLALFMLVLLLLRPGGIVRAA